MGGSYVLIPLSLSTSGTPASPKLRTLGAQLPTQLHSWSYSLAQGPLPIRQLQLYHPLPHTSFKGAPSLYHTQDLEVTWTWDPSQCTEPCVVSQAKAYAVFP